MGGEHVVLEPGMTLSVRRCPVEGKDLVTVVYDPEFPERMEDYRKHRKRNPVLGINLALYATHCAQAAKPVDANAVGPSLGLYALHELEGLSVRNLPPWGVEFSKYGHSIFSN